MAPTTSPQADRAGQVAREAAGRIAHHLTWEGGTFHGHHRVTVHVTCPDGHGVVFRTTRTTPKE